MTLPITVLLKILIWHQMDISTNVDKHIHTHTHTKKTNKHTHTQSQLTGAKGHRGGSQVLARYHIKNNTHFTDC